MHIAVATSKGIRVDQHFGKTESFFIYSCISDSLSYLKTVWVTPYGQNDTNHAFAPERLEGICNKLQGCTRIYCTKIGERPRQELARRGVEAVEYTGEIETMPL